MTPLNTLERASKGCSDTIAAPHQVLRPRYAASLGGLVRAPPGGLPFVTESARAQSYFKLGGTENVDLGC